MPETALQILIIGENIEQNQRNKAVFYIFYLMTYIFTIGTVLIYRFEIRCHFCDDSDNNNNNSLVVTDGSRKSNMCNQVQ